MPEPTRRAPAERWSREMRDVTLPVPGAQVEARPKAERAPVKEARWQPAARRAMAALREPSERAATDRDPGTAEASPPARQEPQARRTRRRASARHRRRRISPAGVVAASSERK